MSRLNFSWPLSSADIASLRAKRATLVLAPREMTQQRVKEIIKLALTRGDLIFGIAEEAYVSSFEGQPQFKMLDLKALQPIQQTIASANSPRNFSIITYPQSQTDDLIRSVRPNRVIVVRGSYSDSFHRLSTYKLLRRRNISFEYQSPFVNDGEAREYLTNIAKQLPKINDLSGSAEDMMTLAKHIASRSFDYVQVGAVIAEKTENGYKLLESACNEVIPFQAYAWHYGSSREDNLAGFHDAYHYDTIHAEMNAFARLSNKNISLKGKSLFVSMMCCPNCARNLSVTELDEVIYADSHSEEYSEKLFEDSGIKVRRIEP